MTAKIIYNSEEHGPLDVEFKIEDFNDLQTLMDNGPGRGALKEIRILPGMLTTERMPRNETIESLLRQLEQVDDIKNDAIDGADRFMARSTQGRQLAEKQTNAQSAEQQKQPVVKDAGALERMVSDWLGVLAGPTSPPLLGAG